MAVTGLSSISDGIVTFPSLPVYPVIVTLSPLISYVKSPYVKSSAVVPPAANTVMGSIPNTMHRESSNAVSFFFACIWFLLLVK